MLTKLDAGALNEPLVVSKGALACAWNWFLLPAFGTALVIFRIGYSYGEPSHVIFLPWILHRIDPTLLSNDWFVNTPPHHLNSIRFMSWLGSLVPLPLATAILHVMFLFLLLLMIRAITGELFHDWRIFYVSLFLLLRWGTDGLGGNGLWSNYLVQHNAGVPVCLLAFYLVLRNRPIAAAIACAAATWIHIQLGALTMLVLGVGMLADRRRTGWRNIFIAGGVYLLAVAPTLWQQWTLYVGAPSPLSARDYLEIHAIMRHPHHLIPSSWSGAEYYRFALLLGMAALAGRWREQPHRTVFIWFLTIAALCLAGTVFVEIVPVKLIIKLQTFRMTVFVKFFAVIYTARFLLQVLDAPGVWAKACVLAILVIPNFSVAGVCALLIVAVKQERPWLSALALFAAGCVAGIALVATARLGTPIPMFWHSFAIVTRGMGIALACFAFLAAICWRYPRTLAPVLLVLMVPLGFAAGLPYFGYDHPPIDDWYRFCQQVKLRTPKDAIFITPPVQGAFQLFAERAEVASFKCVPLIETDLVEWKRRLNDLVGYNLHCSGWVDCGSQLVGGYLRLRDGDFLSLARKYNAQYVVTQGAKPLDFPEEFRVGTFVLYRVPR